jgi:hypothetical protein
MEIAEGKLPDGKSYIGRDALLARRAPQVALSKDASYGMGLVVETKYDVTVVHHGGNLFGYYSDMMWLPEHGVGAVVLTNGKPGWLIRTMFRRKLFEELFDGRPEADAELAAAGKTFFAQLAAERKLLTVPAAATEATKLAPHYTNAALGDIATRARLRRRSPVVNDKVGTSWPTVAAIPWRQGHRGAGSVCEPGHSGAATPAVAAH